MVKRLIECAVLLGLKLLGDQGFEFALPETVFDAAAGAIERKRQRNETLGIAAETGTNRIAGTGHEGSGCFD